MRIWIEHINFKRKPVSLLFKKKTAFRQFPSDFIVTPRLHSQTESREGAGRWEHRCCFTTWVVFLNDPLKQLDSNRKKKPKIIYETRLTINVSHQGLCEAFQLVPKRSGDLKVCELRSDAALFSSSLKTGRTEETWHQQKLKENMHLGAEVLTQSQKKAAKPTDQEIHFFSVIATEKWDWGKKKPHTPERNHFFS